MTPSIGRIVQYTLSYSDADAINRRRHGASTHLDMHRINQNGVVIHTGNAATEGQVFPMIITRVLNSPLEPEVNGQVFLDGNDMLWVTSVTEGEGPQHFMWPTLVKV